MPRACGRALSAILIALIKLYKACISPIIPPSCRFHPSCSEYAIAALERHGALRGLLLSAWRILRCGPWSGGGYDPVPDVKEQPKWTREPS